MRVKILSLVVALGILLSCTACGDGNSTASTTTTTATTTTTLTPTPVSSFEYEAVNDGIVITKYIGTDKNVVVPDAIEGKPVTELQYMTFWRNKDLMSVILPKTLVKIGNRAFEECTSLTTVALPSMLQEIGGGAFLKCEKLTEIELPKSLKGLGAHAFEECTSLKQITIPGNCVMGIGAFLNSGLEKVVLEEGITKILGDCFMNTNIQSITFPKTVTMVDWNAFANCEKLETISLNEGLERLEGYAFYGALALTEIVIPSTVTKINETNLGNCPKLTKVKFAGNAPEKFLNILFDVHEKPKNMNFTIYYHEGAAGFTSPEWFGHPTAIW